MNQKRMDELVVEEISPREHQPVDESFHSQIDAPDEVDDSERTKDDSTVPNISTKRKRHGPCSRTHCKRNTNASLREKGQSYLGMKTIVDEAGKKYIMEVPRAERQLRPRCQCKSTVFECKNVTEEMRRHMFDEFWSLSWPSKRVYMNRLVVMGAVERPRNRKKNDRSRRSKSLKYFFEYENARFRVCKTMFLNTFDLSQWSVHGWPRKSSADRSSAANVDCLLDEAADETNSWFEEFLTKLPANESDPGVEKRKNRSPRTSSRILRLADSTSESEVENERAGLVTHFVDVSTLRSDSCSANENVDSLAENVLLPKFEVSSPSDVAVAVQPNIYEMLTEISRRMNEFEEKFENRLQSIESQLQEIWHRIPPKTSEPIRKSASSNSDLKYSNQEEPRSARQMTAEENMRDDQREETKLMESETDPSDDEPKSVSPVDSENGADFVPDPVVRFLRKSNEQRTVNFVFKGSKLVKISHPKAVRTPVNVECFYCKRSYDSDAHFSMHIKRHVNTPSPLDCCHCRNLYGI